MTTRIQLQPNRVVRCNPGSPYFPAFHARTSEAGEFLLVYHQPFRWNPDLGQTGWDGYRSATIDELYTVYRFLDDGTYECFCCCPVRIVYTGTWTYET